MTESVVIELARIHKWFGAVHALGGVDLELRRGEIHALLGQNGAGKSTLIKILTGAITPDDGELRIDGEMTAFGSPADAQAAGIAVVHQDTQVFPALSVAENITAARPPSRWWGPLRLRDRRRAREEAASLLRRLGLEIAARTPAARLRPAEQKLVEIARALASAHVRVLVLDEPTAALEPREAQRLFALLGRLRDEGVAVLFVSHKLDEVLQIAQPVTVLRDGRVVARERVADLELEKLVRLVAGGEVEPVAAEGVPLGEEILRARAVQAEGVGPADLDVQAGEVVALTGLLGAGASAFLRAVVGARGAFDGEVVVRGQRIRLGDRAAATDGGVGFVPEDRKAEGIVPDLSVEANIALASIDAVSTPYWLSRRRIREQAEHYIRLLDIRPPVPTMPVGNLSGGNQQKVLLARWLASQACLLAAEEPTHGLDVRAKPEIQRLLRRFAADGGAVVIASGEVEELLDVADRIAVFRAGKLAALLPSGASETEVTAAAVGLSAGSNGEGGP